MPKRRPIFEYKGLSGLLNDHHVHITTCTSSSSSSSSHHHSRKHHHLHLHHNHRRDSHKRTPKGNAFFYSGPRYNAPDRHYRKRNLERSRASRSTRPLIVEEGFPDDKAAALTERAELQQQYIESLRLNPNAIDPKLERLLGLDIAGNLAAQQGLPMVKPFAPPIPVRPANFQGNPIVYPQPRNAAPRREQRQRNRSGASESEAETRDGSTRRRVKKSSDDDDERSGKGDSDEKSEKKVGFVKGAALAVGALAVGFMVKRFFSRRKQAKEEEQAEADAVQSDMEGPFGGTGGFLLSGPDPLQLQLPHNSFSIKVPQNEAFIVEKGGEYDRILKTGSNIIIPCVERVGFRFTLKEVGMGVPFQQCFTRDNVSIRTSGVLFARIEDPVAAAYEVDDVYRSLMLLAQTCMRNELANLLIEQVYEERDTINYRVLTVMNDTVRPWGVRCTKFEIRDLDIPEDLRMTLDRQTQMERQARAEVIASEAQRDAMVNRAEGEMQAQMRMSQARQIDLVNQAIGEAHAITERGEAIAGALRDLAEVVNEPGGEQALQMRIAEQYLQVYGRAAANGGAVPNAADAAAVLNNAMGLLQDLGDPGATAKNGYVTPGAVADTSPQTFQSDGGNSATPASGIDPHSGEGSQPGSGGGAGPSPGMVSGRNSGVVSQQSPSVSLESDRQHTPVVQQNNEGRNGGGSRSSPSHRSRRSHRSNRSQSSRSRTGARQMMHTPEVSGLSPRSTRSMRSSQYDRYDDDRAGYAQGS